MFFENTVEEESSAKDITSVIVDPDIPGFHNPVRRKIKGESQAKDPEQGFEGDAYILDDDKGESVSIFKFFCIPFRKKSLS